MNAATLIDAHQRIAAHEAAHAAAGLLLGMNVKAAVLDDDRPAGRVLFDHYDHDPQSAAVMVIAAAIADGHTEPEGDDARKLQELADVHGVNVDLATRQALELTGTREFERLAVGIGHLLEQRGTLDEHALHKIKAIAERATMHRKYVEATEVTTLGEGEMLAYASTFHNVDKHGDRVMPGAFTDTVARIKGGASIPLVWGHDVHGSPQNIVGDITDADQTSEGLRVFARFDLEDPVARKAWRLVRNGRIDKLSIGYRVPSGGERRVAGVNELHKVDVHEVSLVLMPANDRARVLAVKSDDGEPDDVLDPVDHDDPIRTEWRDLMTKYLGTAKTTTSAGETLKAKAMRIAREESPITIASFEC
jgi:HK97 family phage prohead protease